MNLRGYLKAEQFTLNEKTLSFVLILSLGLILFNNLSGYDLPSFDDTYYAQKAKEVLTTGDLFTLRHGEVPRFDNTPFYIWLMALMFKLFGVSEYNARFFSALSCVGSLITIFFIASVLYCDKWAKFFSVFILATTFWYTKYAMHAMFDVTLSFLYTLAMLGFILGVKKDQRYLLLSGIFVGFSILTKSLLGIFPLIIMSIFLLFYDYKKLFYTDRMLKRPANSYDSLLVIMVQENEYGYIKREDYEYYFKENKKEFPVIVGTKKYVLFTNEKNV